MTRTLLALTAPLFILSACNGDKEDTADTGDTIDTVDTADTMDTEDTSVNASSDIVDVAVATPELSILVDAVIAAGLEDTLRSDGSFTVFAPTNDAFKALGVDLDTLSTEELVEILTYHVIAGAEVDSSSIPDRADSVADYTLFFDTSSGVMVNDATVTTADVGADNGIVHIIDTVLLPPTLLDAAVYSNLDGLVGAVTAADPAVAKLLGAPGDYTVFAPTDAAFDAVSDVTAGLDQQQLTDVLSYHLIGASVASGDVPGMASTLLVNQAGYGVTAIFDTSSGVVINGSSAVAVADIKTTNGIAHVVDAVLLPPTIVDHAVAAGLTSLVDAAVAADGDIPGVLSSPGAYTVFAPTNQAFADIAKVTATLTPEELRDVLLYHVVGSYAASDTLSNGMVATLLSGESVQVMVNSSGVTVDGAAVLIADVHATNGVVHVVDTVLLP